MLEERQKRNLRKEISATFLYPWKGEEEDERQGCARLYSGSYISS